MSTNGVAEVINTLPVKRWFAVRAAIGMSTQDILNDPIAILVVAAHEQWKKETKPRGDDFGRFLDMSLPELQEVLGIEEDEEESEDDSKSDEAVSTS